MKVSVIASTKVGYEMPKGEALDFSGKSAGICYMPDTFEAIMQEPKEKTESRTNDNITSQHHSVFGHPTYNLLIENCPKILAMILNNEKCYCTSEKSARYTRMKASSKEKELYEEWIEIFKKEIKRCYPDFPDKDIRKKAMENARYLISVFTPATTMEYTVSFEQLNYIIYFANEFIKNAPKNRFNQKTKRVLRQFLKALPDLEVEGLDPSIKQRKFSLFGQREHSTEWGENYSYSYYGSFAELAQAQRHRTLWYEMMIPEGDPRFFVPPIIEGTDLEKEWLYDIQSLKDEYPQGMLVWINERGTIENFVLKCTERLCGCAQLEIMQQTKKTMSIYVNQVEGEKALKEYLEPYSRGARCTFPGWKCNKPCVFGPKDAMTRII